MITLALPLAAALAGLVYTFIIHPFFLSPLRNIPRAHWSVPLPYLGSLWILYQRFRSVNNAKTYEAHQKHGPIVRLGDNEISINCYEGGIKTIYAGGAEKHEWYPRQFANFGVLNMFSTVGHHPHSQKKRNLANIYSKTYIQNSPQVQANSKFLMEKRIMPLLERLASAKETVDVHELNNAFTMDFMTAYQFGIEISTNFIQDEEIRKKYLHLYHSRRNWQFISSEIPPWVRRALQAVRISLYPDWIHQANDWLEDWSRKMCDKADNYLKQLHGADMMKHNSPGSEPVVFKQYANGLSSMRRKDPMAGIEIHPHLDEGMNFSGLADEQRDRTTLEVYSEMVDHLAAGHETSAVALTYLNHEISKHPEMQEKLHREVSGLTPSLKWSQSTSDLELPDTRTIDNLPYLNAVLYETLRLHSPIPGMQPRVTPNSPGGSSLGPPGQTYNGLPGGIRVSAMPYTLHRINSVFPEPEVFNPDRWLNSSPEQLKEMHRHFWAFGSGGRMCIGSHFAIQEIKLIVSAIYTNYQTEIVNDEGIEELDAYTTRPTSGKLEIRFVKR